MKKGGVITLIFTLTSIVIVLVIQHFFHEIPLDKLLPILLLILVCSIGASTIGYFVLKEFIFTQEKLHSVHVSIENIHSYVNEIQQGILELQKTQALLASDKLLQKCEREATLICIVSPDLKDDDTTFYKTILSNVKANKSYRYVIPRDDVCMNKMAQLRKRLSNDANIPLDVTFPVQYMIYPMPVSTGCCIYENLASGQLIGFLEIPIGPHVNDISHAQLPMPTVHKLRLWFEDSFVRG